MTEQVSICIVQSKDWKLYRRLCLESLQNELCAFGGDLREEKTLPAERWIERLVEKDVYGVWVNKRLVAMMSVHYGVGITYRHIASIYWVYVTKEFRGKGISQRMFTIAFEAIKSKNIKKATLSVTTTKYKAISVYLQLGFEIVGIARSEMFCNGAYRDMYRMEKYFD